jgi:predicted CoA-binding protein
VKISTLDKLEINSTVDVVAIVRAATDINEIVSTKLNGEP